MKRLLASLLVALAAAAFAAPGLRADRASSSEEVRQRLERRLPAVDSLKARKVAGENNRGFLEIRANGSEEDDVLVSEENRDRAEVYSAIAKKTDSTPEVVGRQRARIIAERASPGLLLQAEDGSWYEKK